MAIQMQRSGQLKFYNAPVSDYGYIDSLEFKVNGKAVKWEFLKDTLDICIIYLNEKLLPGNSISITTPFRVKIPGADFSRLGRYKQSYQITQWYPKPAVYDQFGWHQMPYLNEGEFYSEFGKFDVSITVPENYTIAATGVLQNPEEIDRLNTLALQTANINTFNKENIGFPVSSKTFKTLRFVQDSIHDFAWFADKRFYVLKGTVELPNNHKNVTTWIYFTNFEGNLWKNAIPYVNNAVYYYSKWLGDYPYLQCTAVESALGAGGGMEYPMITNIGQSGNAESLEEVIVHEVGHNWFYGMLGSNEREHPWMDEGINSFYEQRYTSEIKHNKGYYGDIGMMSRLFGTKVESPFDLNRMTCDYIARNGSDQALDLHSEAFLFENYGIVPYMKGANAMNYLFHYFGEKEFDRCMQAYFEKWKFRHPYPIDLQKVLEEKSGKNLDWFFTGINKKTDKSDYKIKRLKNNKKTKQPELEIKNKGKLLSPLNFALLKDGKIIDSTSVEGFSGKKTFTLSTNDFDKVAIDPEKYMFELKRTNNYSRAKGLLKKTEPLEFRFLGILENPERTQLFYTPVIGWNASDGLLPGLLFYNPIIPERTVQYRLMPMFGTKSGNIAGTGYAEYKIYPTFLNLQNITLFADYNRFEIGTGDLLTTWQKYEGGIRLLFKRNAIHPLNRWMAEIKAIQATDLFNENKENQFINAFAVFKSHSKIMPFSCEFNTENGPEYMKGWTDCSWQINYKNRKTGFRARIFAGTFLYNNKSTVVGNNFHLSGTMGWQDYQFSEIFPKRDGMIKDNDLWSRQFINNDGGFGIYTPIQSNAWLTSLNLEAAFPIPVPLSIYFNIATYNNAAHAWSGSTAFPFEMGIELKIIPDIFVIYFPVKMSNDVKTTNELYTTTYTEKIRFTLNFSKLIPFKYTNEIPLMF